MAAGLAVDRADVEAGAAADAAEDLPAFAGEHLGPAVVDEDDVHLLGPVGLGGVAGAGDELRVDREVLRGGGAAEQVQQDAEVAVARDDLLDPDEDDVAAGGGDAEAGVALVGDQDDAAALGGDKVGAGEADVGREVLVAEVVAGAAGDRRGIVVVGAKALPLEAGGDLAAVLVDDRPDDVAGVVVVDLDDELAEVGLERLHPVAAEVVGELDLLADHRLGLHHLGGAALAHDAEHVGAGGLGGAGPVDLGAVGAEAGLGLRQVGVEVLDRVLLDLAGEGAEAVRVGELVEEQARALLVGGLRALVDRGALVRGQRGRELVDGLDAHGLASPPRRASRSTWARWSVRIGRPSRAARPPRCIRQLISAET